MIINIISLLSLCETWYAFCFLMCFESLRGVANGTRLLERLDIVVLPSSTTSVLDLAPAEGPARGLGMAVARCSQMASLQGLCLCQKGECQVY